MLKTLRRKYCQRPHALRRHDMDQTRAFAPGSGAGWALAYLPPGKKASRALAVGPVFEATPVFGTCVVLLFCNSSRSSSTSGWTFKACLDYLLHEGNLAACLSWFEHLYCTRHAGKLRAVFCCKLGMYKFALHGAIRKIRGDETMKPPYQHIIPDVGTTV